VSRILRNAQGFKPIGEICRCGPFVLVASIGKLPVKTCRDSLRAVPQTPAKRRTGYGSAAPKLCAAPGQFPWVRVPGHGGYYKGVYARPLKGSVGGGMFHFPLPHVVQWGTQQKPERRAGVNVRRRDFRAPVHFAGTEVLPELSEAALPGLTTKGVVGMAGTGGEALHRSFAL